MYLYLHTYSVMGNYSTARNKKVYISHLRKGEEVRVSVGSMKGSVGLFDANGNRQVCLHGS